MFNTESCTVFAVDSRTGEQLWSWWLGDPLTSAPTISGGLVFTSYPATPADGAKPRPPGASHALVAFDLKTGAIKWQKWLDSDVMSAPVVAGEFLYVSTFGGTVMKLEPATGKGALRHQVSRHVGAGGDLGGRARVDVLHAPRRGRGGDRRRRRDDHPHRRQPPQDQVHREEEAGQVHRLRRSVGVGRRGQGQGPGQRQRLFGAGAPASANAGAAAGNVGVASVSTMQGYQGSRILHLGATNVNTMGDEIVATNAETGDELWTARAPPATPASTAATSAPRRWPPAGASWSRPSRARSSSFEPTKGVVQKRHAIGGTVRSQPVVDQGWIVVGTDDGRLVAIDTHDKTLTGWPMWGGNAARTGAIAAK